MSARVDSLIEMLCASWAGHGTTAAPFSNACSWLVEAADEEVEQLLDRLDEEIGVRPASSARLLDAVFLRLVQRGRSHAVNMTPALRRRVGRLYERLGPTDRSRWMLLQWLAGSEQPRDLAQLVHHLVTDPPHDAHAASLVLVPLFQMAGPAPTFVFPALLDALAHPVLAAPVLDLANHLVRSGRATMHPARHRSGALMDLLGQLVQRLASLEEQPPSEQTDLRNIGSRVEESVSLIIALCDALAWIGDREAVGKLYQALDLHHRRIQAEAAAALARLGETAGQDALVRLAAEPVTRLRALADAEPLGLLERIAPEFQTEEALAEAEVALTLAQPAYFGLPPQQLEHVDSRMQYWPSYEQPVRCHLFRYAYNLAGGHYSNVAIAGPLTHTLTADLNDLAPADIYAVYAGWQAEHASMVEVEAEHWTESQRGVAEQLAAPLSGQQFHEVRGLLLGKLDQRWVLVAEAVRDTIPGLVLCDGEQIHWYPARQQQHPLGPREIYWLYKGTRLLRLFNP